MAKLIYMVVGYDAEGVKRIEKMLLGNYPEMVQSRDITRECNKDKKAGLTYKLFCADYAVDALTNAVEAVRKEAGTLQQRPDALFVQAAEFDEWAANQRAPDKTNTTPDAEFDW